MWLEVPVRFLPALLPVAAWVLLYSIARAHGRGWRDAFILSLVGWSVWIWLAAEVQSLTVGLKPVVALSFWLGTTGPLLLVALWTHGRNKDDDAGSSLRRSLPRDRASILLLIAIGAVALTVRADRSGLSGHGLGRSRLSPAADLLLGPIRQHRAFSRRQSSSTVHGSLACICTAAALPAGGLRPTGESTAMAGHGRFGDHSLRYRSRLGSGAAHPGCRQCPRYLHTDGHPSRARLLRRTTSSPAGLQHLSTS